MTIVVLEEEGDGEWEMIPAPSLLAEPSIPRHSKRPPIHQLTDGAIEPLAYQLAVMVKSFYEMLW